jgi:hypothetical protein
MIGRSFYSVAAALCLVAASAYSTVAAAVLRFADLLFETIAEPFRFPPGFGRVATAGPALDYDAPPAHGLRHEAGVSRRSAARNT